MDSPDSPGLGKTQSPPGRPRLFLVVPAYNAGSVLVDVIDRALPLVDHIVIVDDGSREADRPTFETCDSHAKVTVLRHRKNLGKGFALKTGIEHCLRDMQARDSILTMDSDGQHAPEDIARFSACKAQHPDAGFILGERRADDKMPPKSRLGNTLARLLFKIQFGGDIHDTQSGFRLLSRDFAQQFIQRVRPGRYETEMDMLILASRTLNEIHTVDIDTIYLEGNRRTHFKAVTDSLSITKLFLKYGAVSLASFLIDYLLFIVLVYLLGVSYIQANILARIISAVMNFAGHKYISFETRGILIHEGGRYVLAVFFSLFLSTALLYIAVDLLHLPSLVLKPVIDGLIFIVNFLVLNKLVFSEKR